MRDEQLAAVAASQQGLVERGQALRLGASDGFIRHRVTTGRWIAVLPGVYLIAGSVGDARRPVIAACLAAGADAGASHRTAAATLLGKPLPDPLEISTPREVRLRTRTVKVHRSRDLAPEHLDVIEGMRVTTPARTLVDLGQVAPWWEVASTLDELLSRRLVTVPNVRAAVELHSRRGRRGVGVLRRVLADRGLGDQAPDSVLEAAFADLCRRAGLPVPEHQVEVSLGGLVVHLDFAFVDVRLAIELDGYEFHSDRVQFERDRERDARLTASGWTVCRFTWHQVIHRPGYVLAVLDRTLRHLGHSITP